MSAEQVVRVSGTDDAGEIAAVLAALSSVRSRRGVAQPSGYERWRALRQTALGRTARHAVNEG